MLRHILIKNSIYYNEKKLARSEKKTCKTCMEMKLDFIVSVEHEDRPFLLEDVEILLSSLYKLTFDLLRWKFSLNKTAL